MTPFEYNQLYNPWPGYPSTLDLPPVYDENDINIAQDFGARQEHLRMMSQRAALRRMQQHPANQLRRRFADFRQGRRFGAEQSRREQEQFERGRRTERAHMRADARSREEDIQTEVNRRMAAENAAWRGGFAQMQMNQGGAQFVPHGAVPPYDQYLPGMSPYPDDMLPSFAQGPPHPAYYEDEFRPDPRMRAPRPRRTRAQSIAAYPGQYEREFGGVGINRNIPDWMLDRDWDEGGVRKPQGYW